jgi:hypothetical protein
MENVNMEGLKLLNEECIAESKILTESVGSEKRMYITGPFIQAETRNRNGRVYPLGLIEREVKKFQKLIESHEAVGELNHPEDGNINPDRAAILITELKMDGNLAMGKAKVLSTPCGKILESLINDGVKMGVSTRGTGNLTNENTVENDFNLITIDSVYMPSGQSCYSEAINESVEWMLNESTGLYIEKRKQKMDKARNEFNAKLDKYGSKIVVEAFKEFISKL